MAFTAGFKLEHNDFTGFECQPSLRLLWMLDKKSSAWGAVSRAVRTPDVWEYYGTSIGLPVAPGVPLFPVTTANPNIISESLMAYELGYRVQATDKFSWDVALFYNQYDSIVTYSPGLMTFPFFPVQGNNEGPATPTASSGLISGRFPIAGSSAVTMRSWKCNSTPLPARRCRRRGNPALAPKTRYP